MAKKKKRSNNKKENKYQAFAELLAEYRSQPVVLKSGDVVLATVEAESPPEASVKVDVPLQEALEALGVELSEAEVKGLAEAKVDLSVALAALQVAQDVFDLKDLLKAVGADPDALDVLGAYSPKWVSSLKQLLNFPVEVLKREVDADLFGKLWEKATLDEKIDVAATLGEDVPELKDYLAEAWKQFDSMIYNARLVPLLMGFDEQEYAAKKTAAYSVVNKAAMVRGPEWVVALKKGVQVVEALPARKLGKKKLVIDAPVVRLVQRPKDSEEAIDLLDGATVVLKTKVGVLVILCAYASEIYVVDRGQVFTVPWSEYVNNGLPFIYRYARPEDVIKYVVVNPKKNSKLVFSHSDIAALLRHFGYDSEEKLKGELPDEVIPVILKIQQALPRPMLGPAQGAQEGLDKPE